MAIATEHQAIRGNIVGVGPVTKRFHLDGPAAVHVKAEVHGHHALLADAGTNFVLTGPGVQVSISATGDQSDELDRTYYWQPGDYQATLQGTGRGGYNEGSFEITFDNPVVHAETASHPVSGSVTLPPSADQQPGDEGAQGTLTSFSGGASQAIFASPLAVIGVAGALALLLLFVRRPL